MVCCSGKCRGYREIFIVKSVLRSFKVWVSVKDPYLGSLTNPNRSRVFMMLFWVNPYVRETQKYTEKWIELVHPDI
jgi:hypothetical protein